MDSMPKAVRQATLVACQSLRQSSNRLQWLLDNADFLSPYGQLCAVRREAAQESVRRALKILLNAQSVSIGHRD